jgi:hypothetical protein
MTPYINQAIALFGMMALCVGVVTLLFSACRVVRRMWK